QIRVQNYRAAPMKMEVALVAPSEWTIEPDVLRFEATTGGKVHREFRISVPRDWRPSSPRFAIAADVLCDGKYRGQITEAVVDVSA
ncbi:MAG: hypothetical protein L0338_04255, partial [Acidobacteria bacterium]|nr:hypothetical protein [Acidobacteriota bacterium]